MTQEKELLLKDLCARLPYGVICECLHSNAIKATAIDTEDLSVYYFDCDEWESIEHCKPYLRPMSSMTEEEEETLRLLKNQLVDCDESNDEKFYNIIDEIHSFYYSHHIDSNNLIPIGLAIAVTKENKPYKE